MRTPEERRALARKAILTRHLGADHPDTIEAGRKLAEARADAAQAEADRWRAIADAMAVA